MELNRFHPRVDFLRGFVDSEMIAWQKWHD